MVESDRDVEFVSMWRSIWSSRWLIVGITASFALASVTYALLATPWYRASVLLVPVKEKATPGLLGQLGGLASLAGITVDGTATIEAVAVLKSRNFARAFIEDQALLPVLFSEQWDSSSGQWQVTDPPDVYDAIELFDKVIRVIEEDRRTGLVRLSIEWKDPQLAAAWAHQLVDRVNDYMRQRELAEATANVAYLKSELQSTQLVELQQSVGRLLENEMEKLMVARGNSEFAFRVVDGAEVPKWRSRPKRTLIVIIGTVLGGMLCVLLVIMRDGIRVRNGKSGNSTLAPSIVPRT